MKRIAWTAVYSACLSAICVSVYITFYGATVVLSGGHQVSIRSLAEGFSMIVPLVVLPAAAFGLILGLLGGWIMSRVQIATRPKFVTVSALLGGLLGCVPPTILLCLSEPEGQMPFGFLPCMCIGAVCAGSWAILWSRSKQRNNLPVPR